MIDGLYQVMVDHKEVFNALVNPPIILNNLKIDTSTSQGRDELSKYLSMTFTSDALPHIPTCVGGHIGGEDKIGRMCDRCHTRVAHVVDRQLEDCIWLAPPEDVKAFIHPEIWSCIDNALVSDKNVSVLLWMTDPNQKPILEKYASVFEDYEARFERGMNYFHDHFDEIMEFVLASPWVKSSTDIGQFWEFLVVHREMIFQPHLPLPSSVFVINEKSSRGSLADDMTPELLNAIYTITNIYSSAIRMKLRAREAATARASQAFAKCHNKIATSFLGSKPGMIRKQWISSRQFFTSRAVVTSISGAYHYEEVHLPWAAACGMFEPHLVNLLMKRGYLEDDALAFIEDHTMNDDESGSMRALFDELLSLCDPIPGWEVKDINTKKERVAFEQALTKGEVPEFFPKGVFKDLDIRAAANNPLRGYPVLIHRPPTLTRLSIQNTFITKIKEPHDRSLGLPDSALKGSNGDFDGDEYHTLLSLDEVMAKRFTRLRQHLGVRSLRRPRKLSEFQMILAPLAATFMNAVHGEE